MLIWRGLGILVPVVAISVGASVHVALTAVAGKDQTWSVGVGLLVAGVALWFLGKKLNGSRGRELVDPQTGERLVYRKKHDFFWIPVEYCGVVVGVGGLISAVTSLFR